MYAGQYGARQIRTRGFTYLGLLMLVAVIGIAASATVTLGSIVQRRAAEEELLRIGTEFRSALQSYAHAEGVAGKRYPATLEDLVKDVRFPSPKRHLRQLYADPLTGKAEWGIAQAPGGGIAGIYSKAQGRPIKIGNFQEPFKRFAQAQSYGDWVFTLEPY